MDGMKLPTPPVAALLLAVFSAAALAAALIGQYGFNLHPCHLCLIQRIPFAVVILFGLVGFFAKRIATWMVGLSGARAPHQLRDRALSFRGRAQMVGWA